MNKVSVYVHSRQIGLTRHRFKQGAFRSILEDLPSNLERAAVVKYLKQTFVVAMCAIMMQGCYHVRLHTAANEPGTNYESKTVHTMFWGLLQEDVVASNCDALKVNGVDEVRVTTNYGYALITVFTLGIWCPSQIEWKPCPREGDGL